jgi:hypothetical protein
LSRGAVAVDRPDPARRICDRGRSDRVWAILADVERWPEWTASVSRIERLDRHPLGLGSRLRIDQPKLPPGIWVVTIWEPERRFTWELPRPGLTMIGDHRLQAVGEGCALTLDLTFDGWLGGLVALFSGRLAERYMRLEADGLHRRSQSAS